MPRIAHRALAALALLVAVASGSSADDLPKNPLEGAKVGQWVRYKLPQDLEQKLTVTAVDGKKVSVKAETILAGSVVASSVSVTDLEAKAPAPAKTDDVKVEETTLVIKGKKLKCRLTTTATSKTWTSADVPVTGIVKIESNGVLVQELIDWGEPAAAKEKP
jgi:hypothetical protein